MNKPFAKYSLCFALLLLAGCGAAEPTLLEKWGLGKEESEYVSLNRDYEWFIDQRTTGVGFRVNCAPTCAIMAAKWADEGFGKTVADVRGDTYLYNEHGVMSGMSLSDIYHWLIANGIPCDRDYGRVLELSRVKRHLDNGDILIVSVNMYDISYNKKAEQRTGKHYLSFDGTKIYIPGANHAIVVKGYRVVDGVAYFEVYDSAGGQRYGDGEYKGKDRYYLAGEVLSSARKRGGDYLIISPKVD